MYRCYSNELPSLLCAVLALASPTAAVAEEFNPLKVRPAPATPGTPLTFLLEYRCEEGYTVGGDMRVNARRVNTRDRAIAISYELSALDIESLSCRPEYHAYEIPFPGVDVPGRYQIELFNEPSHDFEFAPERLTSSFELYIMNNTPQQWPEAPVEGSLQSGVGTVRGWACNAESIEVQFDDLPRMTIAYGDTRTDTRAICGDNENGYSMAISWNSLGVGEHTMRTFIDGEEISQVDFMVIGLDVEFLQGASGEYELDDFPALGSSVTVRWSEADQSFIVIDRVD